MTHWAVDASADGRTASTEAKAGRGAPRSGHSKWTSVSARLGWFGKRLHGQLNGDLRSRAGAAVNHQLPAECFDAVGESYQAGAPADVGAADAVIAHRQQEHALTPSQ